MPITDRFGFKEMVEILADYDIEHCNNLPSVRDMGSYDGLVYYDKKKIYISGEPDFVRRRETVIHELLHVFHRMKYEKNSDSEIEKEVQEICMKYWGS